LLVLAIFLELATELLIAALFLLSLLTGALIDGERKIEIAIAAVEMPEHRPTAFPQYLAQRAIVVDHGLLS
jgi:hypothetical protein